MPSLDVIEQFKEQVQSLARENEIRRSQGLPPDEITPPESQLTDDLADLLGGKPGEGVEEPQDLDSLLAENFETGDEGGSEELEPAAGEDDLLSGLFDSPAASEESLSLDDLLGPGKPEETFPEAETETPSMEEPSGDVEDLGDFGSLSDLGDFGELVSEPEAEPLEAVETSGAGEADPFADMDFGTGLEEAESAAFEMDDPTSGASDGDSEEFVFDDGTESDFGELAGFASTKEEDVEAFDAMGEADEFQLGDFESQFGITADDHTDASLLNPAQSVDQEIAAAQKTLSLTEEEFAAIQKTLSSLPLNLKLAVEELIGEKEVVFEDLNRVVRLLVTGGSARTLAALVGRVLGRKIQIPAGFEKGSGEALEERQASLWFNLRVAVAPTFRISIALTIAAAILVVLGWNFLYKPLKSQDLYDKGLQQVKLNNGEQADDLFAQAYYYWPAQDRFFQFAEAYTDTGDYDRARRKYLELLKPSIKPFRDADQKRLTDDFASQLAPLPEGLSEGQLQEKLQTKKETADAFYTLVIKILSRDTKAAGQSNDDFQGDVVFGNPQTRALLDLSKFETLYGADGIDVEAHFRRADAVLRPLFEADAYHKEGLLRRGDNFLEWAAAVSSRDRFNDANTAFSVYLQRYGEDAPITWRFVNLFILTDNEKALLSLKSRIELDKKLAMDGETTAKLAKWLIDKEEARARAEAVVEPKLNTLEDEYGIRASASTQDAVPGEAKSMNVSRDETGTDKSKDTEILPPYKYPYSSQRFRPLYIEDLDQLILRALETHKELPELHYQLSRYYRLVRNPEEEQKALAAADAYFQRLEPKALRLNGRPYLRIATLNRIGEIFEGQDQPLQAEKYYLEAERYLETAEDQKLVRLDQQTAVVYRNLGNLYYQQAPGATEKDRLGAWDQALKLFQKAEEGNLNDPLVTYRKGVIFYEQGLYSEAVKEFFSLGQTVDGRTNVNLLYSMGNTLFRNGNFFAAEGYYKELMDILKEKRKNILTLDVVGRSSHKALMLRIVQTENNIAATLYRGTNTYKTGTREFREALATLTMAQGMAISLGKELYESQAELDITKVDDQKLQAIRDEQAQVVARTRKEKGLIEANLQALSLVETAPQNQRAQYVQEMEIFSRIPLEYHQADAP